MFNLSDFLKWTQSFYLITVWKTLNPLSVFVRNEVPVSQTLCCLAYYISSIDLLTKLFNASPRSIPFCKSARSMS